MTETHLFAYELDRSNEVQVICGINRLTAANIPELFPQASVDMVHHVNHTLPPFRRDRLARRNEALVHMLTL